MGLEAHHDLKRVVEDYKQLFTTLANRRQVALD